MTQSFSASLKNLSDPQKICFWARLANDLTVAARGTYLPDGCHVANPEKLRSFNEIQHQVSAQILQLALKSTDRFSDDELIQALLQQEETYEDSRWALNRSLNQV